MHVVWGPSNSPWTGRKGLTAVGNQTLRNLALSYSFLTEHHWKFTLAAIPAHCHCQECALAANNKKKTKKIFLIASLVCIAQSKPKNEVFHFMHQAAPGYDQNVTCQVLMPTVTVLIGNTDVSLSLSLVSQILQSNIKVMWHITSKIFKLLCRKLAHVTKHEKRWGHQYAEISLPPRNGGQKTHTHNNLLFLQSNSALEDFLQINLLNLVWGLSCFFFFPLPRSMFLHKFLLQARSTAP